MARPTARQSHGNAYDVLRETFRRLPEIAQSRPDCYDRGEPVVVPALMLPRSMRGAFHRDDPVMVHPDGHVELTELITTP